jgi:type II secretory pathway pseudopilin PulG
MLVVISMFTVIAVAVAEAALYFYRNNTIVLEQAFAINSARRGIELMVRDIREASYSDEGAYPIVSMGPYAFTLYSDIDRDKSIEKVRYELSDSNLVKEVINATGDPPAYLEANKETSIVSDSVRNGALTRPIFAYYDASGNEITDMTAITSVVFVKMNLVVNINPSRLPEDFTLRSSATLRNMNTN